MSFFYCLHFWDPHPQPGVPGSCIYFPQEQGSPVIPPRALGLSYILLNDISIVPALENRDYGRRDLRCADHATPLYPQKLTLTSPINGGLSVGIVRSRTKATELLNVYSSDMYNTYIRPFLAQVQVATQVQSLELLFFLLERPNLFAICNNTFSKWWEGWRMSCRRVLSSIPLLVRGSETGGDSWE
jgi:hypothetical protein